MDIALTSAMLESIQSGQPDVGAVAGRSADTATAHGGGFADAMKHAIEQVDAQQRAAGEKLVAVDRGDSDDLVSAVLESQQADLSFSMMVQVRNKVMSAFDDVIKMPV
ncbi:MULTISPECIES: flagellar hook-basal body complex protein FliE [Burkholderia cepacia complex]|uniref:Flagellar hook-basal body complex protein FliE n=1 Tax=Burkholderia metallica TaxID=488729 RepID=A0ABT8PI12_9BURK|nr:MULTISPECIES: flagellar hook-basal body complex protein FliE [Burkholderia cepacia complex]MDN7934703.1 flagellar hook-basal body complex protein FliE [Burkholderia metallica]VWC74345.1 flagellar hook-basal body protein [Burkholderia contaminans]